MAGQTLQSERAVFFELSPVGMARLSPDGTRWIEVNDALCSMLGYSHDELLATSPLAITHQGHLGESQSLFKRLNSGDIDDCHQVARFVHRDGRELWVQTAFSMVRDACGHPEYVIAVIADVSERVTAAAERERLLAAERVARQRVERLAALGHALSSAATPDDVIAAAVNEGARTAGAISANLVMLSDEGTTFTVVAGPSLLGELYAGALRSHNAGGLPAVVAARTGRPCYSRTRAEYVARAPRMTELAERMELRAHAALPLIVGNRGGVLGVLAFVFDTEQEFSPEQDLFLRAVADRCATSLERARLLEVERGARVAAELERRDLMRLLDVLPVMVTVYEPSLAHSRVGPIRFNRAFVATLGWTEGDAADGDIMSRCYPDPDVRARAAAHMSQPDSGWLDIPTRTKDGHVITVRWSNVTLCNERQVGVGVVVTRERRC